MHTIHAGFLLLWFLFLLFLFPSSCSSFSCSCRVLGILIGWYIDRIRQNKRRRREIECPRLTDNKHVYNNKQREMTTVCSVLKNTAVFSLPHPLSFILRPSLRNDKTRHITDACVFSDAMLQLTNQDPTRAFCIALSSRTPTLVRLQIKKKAKR